MRRRGRKRFGRKEHGEGGKESEHHVPLQESDEEGQGEQVEEEEQKEDKQRDEEEGQK